MSNFDKVFYVCAFIAAAGAILFWVFGFAGMVPYSLLSIVLAGFFANVACISKFIGFLRNVR